MANTDFISYSLADVDGQRGTVQIFVPTGQTLADLQTFSNSMVAALDAVTAAVVQAATVTKALTLPGGIKGTATAGHYIQHGANFGFDAANTPYRHTVRVPAILESLLVGETVITDTGDGQAFAAGITGGYTGIAPSDRYGNDLTALLSALRSFRSS
jgi:hypothetical protein